MKLYSGTSIVYTGYKELLVLLELVHEKITDDCKL